MRSSDSHAPVTKPLTRAEALILCGVAAAILLCSRNVLWLDEWDVIGALLLEVKKQGLRPDLLWAPHNEHRMPLPRLIFVLLHGQGLHLLVGQLLSLGVLVLAYRRLLPLLRSATHSPALFPPPAPPPALQHAGPALLCLFFFSFGQKENLLWSMQLAWHLELLGLLLALLAIDRPLDGRFWQGALLAFLCSAHWMILIPLSLIHFLLRLLYRGHRPISTFEIAAGLLRLVILGGLFVVYVRGVQTQGLAEFVTFARQQPLSVGLYFVRFLGAPFYWHGISATRELTLPGGLIFLTLFALLIYNHRKQIKEKVLPEIWLPLATMAIASLICIGRARGDLAQASDSRYQVCVIFGWLGILGGVLRSPGLWRRRPVRALVALVLTASLLGSLVGLVTMVRRDRTDRIQGERCLTERLQNGRPSGDPACERLLYPDAARQEALTRELAAIGVLR